MAQAKQQAVKIAALLDGNSQPVTVLLEANNIIFINNHHVMFTTASYGVIDVTTRKVAYACAGHHPPILAKPGEPGRVLPNHGFPLAVEVNMPDAIREHSFTYESETLLVLYSDGLIESGRDGDDGEAKLLKATREAPPMS